MKFKVIFLMFFLFLGLAAGAAIFYIKSSNNTTDVTTSTHPSISFPKPTTTNSSTLPSSSIPSTLLLKVPFTPQAPTGNWDEIHNEDCEEASAIMANTFYFGPNDVKLNSNYAEGELTRLTDWEQENFGYNLDINSEETVKMIEANFKLHAKIIYSFNEQDIKNELFQNHLILFPGNGQKFGNPNYKQPGPIYHMLIIRGFTASQLITNDPGTRNGLNYPYSFETLYQANGDYDHSTGKVDMGKKNIIVVWK